MQLQPPAELHQLEADMRTEAQRSDALTAKLARQDPAIFNEYVLRDQETGDIIENESFHEEWHDLAEEHQRLILLAYPESGKTNQMLVGRPVWELGNDPTLRIVVLSKTYTQAEKITRAQGDLILHSQQVHDVFPDLKPGTKWTDGMFDVRMPFITNTPSVQAIGLHAGGIMGARIDRLYIDDILDHDNTKTPTLRNDTYDWIQRNVMNRLTRRARVLASSNAWHPEDALHRWARRKQWVMVKYPLRDPVTKQSTWEARFPTVSLDDMEEDFGPLEWARMFGCEARAEGGNDFTEEVINQAKEQGRGYSMLPTLDEGLPPDCVVVTGVDLATGKNQKKGKRQTDLTVLSTVLCYGDGIRQILYIESGRWTGPETLRRIYVCEERFGGPIIVEDNGAQVFLLQFADEGVDPPLIIPWNTTGQKKWNPAYGVASLAIEMAKKKWIFPCTEPYPGAPIEECVLDPEVKLLSEDMLHFDPRQHTGDHLMATWFAREGIRRMRREGARRRESVGVRVLGA